ncbi:BMA-PTR-11, isoform a [Dirofilaria immitis]|nr:BMA-PTR-11, isoform a [Dirofilaria immitis]
MFSSWEKCSEQCPTCRACTSPRNIVKRLYFARCSDRAMNGIESSTENALSTGTPENFNGNRHGNDESCNTIIDYESDSEGSGEQEWAMSVIGDGDSTNGNNTSVIALERSESIVRSEAEGEEELEYHETISNADMATFDASFSDTSSLSLGTLSELFSEIDAVSISSMNHNNMETSNSSDDHEEFNDDSGNTYTSLLLIEHGSNDDHDNSSNDNNSSDSEESDDNDSSDSDKSDDSSDDCGLSEYGHFDHLAVDDLILCILVHGLNLEFGWRKHVYDRVNRRIAITIATYPHHFLLATFLSSVFLSSSLLNSTLENDIRRSFSPPESRAAREEEIYMQFYNITIVPQRTFIIFYAKDSGTMLRRNHIEEMYQIDRLMTDVLHNTEYFDKEFNKNESNTDYDKDAIFAFPTSTIFGQELFLGSNLFDVESSGNHIFPNRSMIREVGTIMFWHLFNADNPHKLEILQNVTIKLLEMSKEKMPPNGSILIFLVMKLQTVKCSEALMK